MAADKSPNGLNGLDSIGKAGTVSGTASPTEQLGDSPLTGREAGDPTRPDPRESKRLTRGQILDRIWGLDYIGDSKTLDVHVKRIRSKIEESTSKPTALLTVRGLGYKLVSKPE